jgi:hypothetical protein
VQTFLLSSIVANSEEKQFYNIDTRSILERATKILVEEFQGLGIWEGEHGINHSR